MGLIRTYYCDVCGGEIKNRGKVPGLRLELKASSFCLPLFVKTWEYACGECLERLERHLREYLEEVKIESRPTAHV